MLKKSSLRAMLASSASSGRARIAGGSGGCLPASRQSPPAAISSRARATWRRPARL